MLSLKAFAMFNIKISCIQGSVTEWIINIYMSTFSPLHKSRSSFLYSTQWIFSPNRSNWLGVSRSHFFCSQAFAAKLACAKDGWGSPIAGMGGAGAGGVVSQSSGSGSDSSLVPRLLFTERARKMRSGNETTRIARVNVLFACNASLVLLVSQMNSSTVTVSSKTSLGNLPYFSLRTNIL